MRRHKVVMVLAAAAALWCVAPLATGCPATAGVARAAAGAVARAGTWRAAIEVPGTGGLNKGGNAAVISVSCASAGNCAAAGGYTDGSGHRQAFVASEGNGTWHAAIEVPGSAALNKGGGAGVLSVSCASAGNCAAAGGYKDGSRHRQAFVASETNGTWHAAIEVPGSAALNKGGFAGVLSVSCASAGNCTAGGYYNDLDNGGQAFVASERDGAWRKAIEVPGTAVLNSLGAEVASGSCASAGNFAAAGGYNDGSGHRQAFVASDANGAWRTAIEVPGTGALNKGGGAGVLSVSCASAGGCAAGGSYTDRSGHQQAFVASQN